LIVPDLRAPAVAVAVLAAAASASACSLQGQGPAVCPVDGRPMATTGPRFFSVSVKELQADVSIVDEAAAAMASAGAYYAGTKVHWELLEPVAGDPSRWELYDPQLVSLLTHGLRPLVTLRGTAPWASSRPDAERPELYPPADVAEWQGFVRRVVRRYGPAGAGAAGGAVRHWEIWNEPNGAEYFRGTVAEYLALLDAAYTVIREEDPAARVWAPAVVIHPWALADSYAFVQQVIENGRFDVLSLHLYFDDVGAMVDVVEEVRARLDAAGRSGVPIAVTEVNAISTVIDCPGYNGWSEAQHVRQLTEVHACLANAGAAAVFWFKSTDAGLYCRPPDDHLLIRNGLLDEEAVPKPRYHRYRELRQCQEAELVFRDGFESGDLAGWSGSAGGG